MSFDHSSIDTLAQRLTPLEPLRRHVRSSHIRGALGCGGAILLSLLLAGLPLAAVWATGNYLTQNSAVIVAIALLSLGLAIYYIVLTMKAVFRWRADAEPAYREQFRRQFLAPSLAEALPGFAVTPHGEFDPAQFDASRLFRSATSLINTVSVRPTPSLPPPGTTSYPDRRSFQAIGVSCST